MEYNFCTLFDKNYFYKGLALYSSLDRYCSNFSLWVLCMDDMTYRVLKKLQLKQVKLISLKEFEDNKLLSIKNSRTFGEYCWTCTPSLILYILKKHNYVEKLCYLDSDMYFYSEITPIFKEFSNNSIMLVPHNYSLKYKYLERIHGKFNVGLLIFRNDNEAISCLQYWCNKCLEWCYDFHKHNKYGDQFYLNDFPKLFNKVYISNNKGLGLAPWNINAYKIKKINKTIYVDNVPLIFYHAAGVKIINNSKFLCLSNDSFFEIPIRFKKILYYQYFDELKVSIKKVKAVKMTYLLDDNSSYQNPDLYAYTLKYLHYIKLLFKKVIKKLFTIVVINSLLKMIDRFKSIESKTYNIFLKNNYYLLKKSYYLPIPPEEDFRFIKESKLVGLKINKTIALNILQNVIAPHRLEFNKLPIYQTDKPTKYYMLNGNFMMIDGNVYYAFIRHYKPKKIIEIGSGFSTLLALEAINRNKLKSAYAKISTKLICIDPYPKQAVLSLSRTNNLKFYNKKVQEIKLSFFEKLQAGDFLFIDSSHILRPGNDVWWLYCEILPRLSPGVFVHVHDVELPKPYPYIYFSRNWYWTEQYLLQALLSFNNNLKIVWPGSYMMVKFPSEMNKIFMPEYGLEIRKYPYAWPSSLWLKVKHA